MRKRDIPAYFENVWSIYLSFRKIYAISGDQEF